jgi:ketosteroid isomerase-like protein
MSAENVEIIRRGLEAFNESGDWDALYSAWDTGVVFELATQEGRESPDFRVYRGFDEARAAVEELMAPFDQVQFEVHECIEVGDDRVLAVLELRMRPKGSAAEVSSNRFAYLYTLRAGKITRVQDYPDPDDGFRAAGLTP